jgi:hypothetical protein
MSDPYAGIGASADPYAGVGSAAAPPPSPGLAKATAAAKRRVASAPAPLRAFNQGATLGFADEIDAGSAALETGANNFVRRMTGQPSVGYGMGDAYKAVMDVESAGDRQFAKDHPVAAPVLQVAGAVLSPAGRVGGGYVSRGANAGARIVRGATVGAMTGAVAGAGGSRGGVKDRAVGAGEGAVVGAMTGGAVTAGIEGATTAARAVNNATGGRFGSPVASAMGRLRDALRADGVDENAINAAVADYERVGASSPTLADVAGENTRALLRFAGSRPGPARNQMQTYREETVHGLPDESINRTRALTPNEPRPAHVVADEIAEGREAAAATTYREPYATPVQIDAQTASALRGDAGRAALQRARQAAAARRNDAQMAEIDSLLASNMEEFPTVSAGTLDRIRIAMGERATTASQRGARDIGGGLRDRANDIDARLDGTPGLEPARAAYRSSSQAMEAISDIGPMVLRAAPDEFGAVMAGLDEQGVQAARVGARQAITDALGQRPNAMGLLDQIAYAPNARRNLTALFGPEEAERFVTSARLNLQRGRNANQMAPNSGSKTFSSEQDAKGFMSVVKAFGRPVEALLERVASGLTVTDAEAAVLVRLGLIDARQAAQAVQPRMTAPVRLGQGMARTIPGAGSTVGMMTGQRR